jgi:hypothetical protein
MRFIRTKGYFNLSPEGTATVKKDAATLFRPARKGGPKDRLRFLFMSAEQAPRVQEAIVQLSVEPPKAQKR